VLRALVFDFDGVLVDSEAAVLQAWRELYAAHGAELPLAEWLTTIGTRDAPWDPARHLEEAIGRTLDWERLDAERRVRELELVSALPLLPGVERWFDDAARLGLPLGLASSSSWRWVGAQLRERGLVQRFDAIVTREDVLWSKPDPAPYVEALSRLGVQGAEALAVEDSGHGVASAKAAGMRVVAVPHGLTAHLDFTGADLLTHSLATLPLETALARLG
jgi:HAD superfamily hydrolase (TIGR01509 family)